MQQAFQQGRGAFEAQKAREAAGAQQLFAQAPQAGTQALREISALESAGKQERAEDQRRKNLLYEQFREEELFPTKTLQEYQSIVRGFPYQPSIYRTEQNLAPSPGIGQTLLGAGMGVASMGKNFGLWGGASGGQIHGGLSGLVQKHQNNTEDFLSGTEDITRTDFSPGLEIALRGKLSGYNGEEEEEEEDITIEDVPINWNAKFIENLEKAGGLYDVYAEKLKQRYNPDKIKEEKEKLATAKKDAAWDELGKFGQQLMAKPWRQAVGESKAFDSLAAARKEEQAGLKALEDEELALEGKLAGLSLQQLKLQNEIVKAAQAGETAKAEAAAKKLASSLELSKFQLAISKHKGDIYKFINQEDVKQSLASMDKETLETMFKLITDIFVITKKEASAIISKETALQDKQGVLNPELRKHSDRLNPAGDFGLSPIHPSKIKGSYK